jgi:hypothetical protein
MTVTDYNPSASNKTSLTALEDGQSALKKLLGTYSQEVEAQKKADVDTFQTKVEESFKKLAQEGIYTYNAEGFNKVINDIIPETTELSKQETDVLYNHILSQMGLTFGFPVTESEKKNFRINLVNALGASLGDDQSLSVIEFKEVTKPLMPKPSVSFDSSFATQAVEDYNELIS